MKMKIVSDCCGAQLIDYEDDYGVCAHCLEWSTGYEEEPSTATNVKNPENYG